MCQKCTGMVSYLGKWKLEYQSEKKNPGSHLIVTSQIWMEIGWIGCAI